MISISLCRGENLDSINSHFTTATKKNIFNQWMAALMRVHTLALHASISVPSYRLHPTIMQSSSSFRAESILEARTHTQSPTRDSRFCWLCRISSCFKGLTFDGDVTERVVQKLVRTPSILGILGIRPKFFDFWHRN